MRSSYSYFLSFIELYYRSFAIICAGILLLSGTVGKAETVISVKDQLQTINLFQYASIYIAERDSTTLKQINNNNLWQTTTSPDFNFGLTKQETWLKFKFQAEELTQPRRFYIRFTNPELNELLLFLNGEPLSPFNKLGSKYSFQQRFYEHPNYIIRIDFNPGDVKELTVKIQTSGSMRSRISLLTDAELMSEQLEARLYLGAYYGLIIIMCLYYLTVFALGREEVYLWFSLSLASLIVVEMQLDGILFQYLYPSSPNLSFSFLILPILSVYVFAFIFTDRFLSAKEKHPLLHKIFVAHQYAAVLIILAVFLLPKFWVLCLLIPFVFTGGGTCILAGLVNIAAGYRSGKFYLLAITAVTLGSLVYTAMYLGVFPSSLFLENILKITSTLEVLLLSFALTDRYREIQLEREIFKDTMLDSLTKANKMKDEFLSVVSHELRTPMNGIQGALDLIKSKDQRSEKSIDNFVGLAEHSTREMVTMINNILDHIDLQNSVAVKHSTFNLRDDFTRLVTDMKNYGLSKGVDLQLKFSDSVAVIYQGDPQKLFKILRHLLSNAMKFTFKGKIVISVDAKQLEGEENQDTLTIVFKDTGTGIKPEHLEKIFEAFRQQDSSMSRDHQGLGLGLPICKALLDCLGGSLDIESTYQQGTVVTIKFKLEVVERKAVLQSNQAMDKPELNILVVEDNFVNMKILVAMINKLGHHTETAENGKIALEKAKQSQFDFVWMDCQMPVMNGLDATREIRKLESYQQVPIVAVTANAFSQDEERCLEAGMTDFLAKPVNREAIERVLSKWS